MKKVNKIILTKFEKGWLSALIDGEGNLSIRFQKCQSSLRPGFECNIRITNTNKQLLKFAQKLVGGSIQKNRQKGNRKTKYVLQIPQASLRKFLPLSLIVKKRQQEILLKTLKLLTQKALGSVKGHRGKTRPLWKDKKLIILKRQMHVLNLKGKENKKQKMARVLKEIILIKTNNNKEG